MQRCDVVVGMVGVGVVCVVCVLTFGECVDDSALLQVSLELLSLHSHTRGRSSGGRRRNRRSSAGRSGRGKRGGTAGGAAQTILSGHRSGACRTERGEGTLRSAEQMEEEEGTTSAQRQPPHWQGAGGGMDEQGEDEKRDEAE